MPPARSDISSSSTARRKRLADKIEALGSPAMAPCPQCVAGGAVCVIQKSSARCARCLRKNLRCDGVFSDAEFDSLEAQKTELSRKRAEARSRLTNLAWELLAVQKEYDSLDKKLEKVHNCQEDMVAREVRALEELDEITPRRRDLVSPVEAVTNPFAADVPVALMSDVDFSWDDPEVLAMWRDSGGNPGAPAG